MDLIIVESPTKAKTLSRFLDKKFQIEATMGHIRDLPKKKLGVDVETFAPDYTVVEGKQEDIAKLKKAAQKAEKVYLATDPDREGEAIAWHVGEILREKDTKILRAKKQKNGLISQSPNIPISRITFHEITQTAIETALEKAGTVNMALVEAQVARRVLDRLVGYKLSPLLWQKIRRGLSAGRVQSVVVRLIVEREKEIEKFAPVEFWEIETLLQKLVGSDLADAPRFLAKLVRKNGEKIEIKDGVAAEEIVGELKKAGYEVASVDQKEFKRNPTAPFTTSTLQQAAANRLGWSSRKTMNVAQGLYENGLITYHRTDSTNLAMEAVNSVRNFIKKTYGENYLPEKPRFFATKSKSAQEAHEAVRPTDVQFKVQSSKFKMGADGEKLYDLIWKRFVACQMAQSIAEITTLTIQADGGKNIYQLETKGAQEKFDGWRKVYGKTEETDEEGNKIESLPAVFAGDELKLLEVKPEQKFTQPPPRFNEASLIKTLEELGIGRPSTYAPTISTIQDRNYVEKQDRQFVPTALGVAVTEFLLEYFPDILDYQFTAKMEDNLDEIANGQKERVPVLREFWKPFAEKLEGVKRVAQRVAVQVEATGEACPKCKTGSVVIRIGRFGKFLSCSRFPECDWRAPYVKKIEGMQCPKCGGEIVYKKTKKGKGFYGCANWPKCDFASWRKPASK
ncbi:MAG TPA: type I DNA topoisomerase [Patescibacteria group bacterium]|nr:type I DNA topoisomerase [Patescibacteria group bacterium]